MMEMNMKKMVAIMALSMSAVSFAKAGTPVNSNMKNTGHKIMRQEQIVVLTPEQQKEFYKMNEEHMKDSKLYMIQIRETELDMQKELLKDEPNMKKLDKLINKKAAFKIKREKEMLNYRIQLKEKFGIENFRGAMRQNMTNNTGRRRSPSNQRLSPEQQQELRRDNINNRKENEEYRLQVREIKLEMQKEMLLDNPDMKKIEMLTEKRIKIQSEMEKANLRNRLELKEKFYNYMTDTDMEDEMD
jgi:Spy/CpxP family protein refolding chaperone